MKKNVLRTISLALCAVLFVTAAGLGIRSAAANAVGPEKESSAPNTEKASAPDAEGMRYIFADAAGETQKVLVSSDGGFLEEAKNVPVTMTVSYTLDGKSVTPGELAGKSGRVTIRFEYRNSAVKNGVHVPYAALTVLVLDNEVFSNAEIVNGRLLNDGTRTLAVGYALPGLQDDLGLGRDTLELPEYVELTADVKDFTLMETYTIVTGEPFAALDPSKLDGVDLEGTRDSLLDAMTQLLDGSEQLTDGLDTLLDGIAELSAGADALSDGAKELSTGLGTLSGNSAALNAGAEQVFDALLATADAQLAAAGLELPKLTPDNYGKVLDGVIASLDGDAVTEAARAQVEAAVNARRGDVEAAVTVKIREGITQKVLAAMGQTPESWSAGVQAGLVTEEQQSQLAAAVDAQMASAEVRALVEQNVEEQLALLVEQNLQSPEVQSQLAAAQSAVQTLRGLRAQLDSYSVFYAGLRQYTAGVDAANVGAGTLSEGAETLRDAMPELSDGAKTLRDGAAALRDGLGEFNREAVQKLVDALDTETLERLQKVLEGADSTSRFLYRTEAI